MPRKHPIPTPRQDYVVSLRNLRFKLQKLQMRDLMLDINLIMQTVQQHAMYYAPRLYAQTLETQRVGTINDDGVFLSIVSDMEQKQVSESATQQFFAQQAMLWAETVPTDFDTVPDYEAHDALRNVFKCVAIWFKAENAAIEASGKTRTDFPVCNTLQDMIAAYPRPRKSGPAPDAP